VKQWSGVGKAGEVLCCDEAWFEERLEEVG
jgi:hypothetical protein